jgi:dTDP-4-amino-4,6-dideoxygalactose transaminase
LDHTDNDSTVPLVDLNAQIAPIRGEILAAIERVVASGQFILGPEVEAFEREIADYCGCSHAVGVSSGTDALLVALMAIGVEAGDEVVTTPFSFFSTAGSIARLGAKPVFVDIEPATFNIDANRIEAAITPRTKVIIPVHLFGQTADMETVNEIAERHGLRVIEDAAQALGAEYHGRRAGGLGHIGCLSFFPTKNLGAMGDAGMVVTSDDQLAGRLRLLRNHGFSPKYHAKLLGGNFRLDALQAAVLRVKLNYLDDWTKARRRHAARYDQLFEEAKLATSSAATVRAIVRPREANGRRHVFHQYVIRLPAQRRDAVQQFLANRGIDTAVYYPVPLHLQECFHDLGHKTGDFAHSESAAHESLALPIYPELIEPQQTHVVQTLADALRQMAG